MRGLRTTRSWQWVVSWNSVSNNIVVILLYCINSSSCKQQHYLCTLWLVNHVNSRNLVKSYLHCFNKVAINICIYFWTVILGSIFLTALPFRNNSSKLQLLANTTVGNTTSRYHTVTITMFYWKTFFYIYHGLLEMENIPWYHWSYPIEQFFRDSCLCLFCKYCSAYHR